MTRLGLLIILTLLYWPGFAAAALSESALAAVELASPRSAFIPLALRFRTISGASMSFEEALGGRPALVLPVDYTCKSICGTAVALVSDALEQTGLNAPAYRLIVIGIDPKDGPPDMERMAAHAAGAATFLAGDETSTRSFLETIGYRAIYDAANDQFAHPAAVLAVTSDGRIARILSSLALDPGDLKLALVEAGRGRVGTIVDRLRLICYGFDAAHGIYTPLVGRLLMLTGTVTLLGVAALLLWLAPARAGRSASGRR